MQNNAIQSEGMRNNESVVLEALKYAGSTEANIWFLLTDSIKLNERVRRAAGL